MVKFHSHHISFSFFIDFYVLIILCFKTFG